ncbi:MAG: C40 family peptidase [Desulfobacteraceae bacterium]|nr:C40 family peptidase [Desulfobacteraceae bacterium]
MNYAMVTTNLLDLRTHSNHAAERASQLLFGQPVIVTSVKKGFARVQQPDGYTGWVDFKFLSEIKRSDFNQWPSQINAVVSSAKGASCFDSSGRTTPPHLLLYGTLVRAIRIQGGLVRLNIPGERNLFVKRSHLRSITRTTASKLSGGRLLTEARKFLGVPYLWGGVSPFGYDCSGFVQSLFAGFGISLPRDTRQQIGVGVKVKRDCTKTGDLLFFDRHVGLAVGSSKILHASRGGGGVRLNSLNQSDPEYRADLDRDYRMARRLF